MKKTIIAGVVLSAALLILGFLPTPRPPVSEIYQRVDPERFNSLTDFRKSHPLKQLTVEGVSWEYLSLGRGEKTILFLHGMAGAADIWWQQMNRLKAEYRMIAVTYPPVPDLKGLDRGVQEILRKESVRRYCLIGSSLGGYLSQYMVLKHPEQIEKAIFANTFPPNTLIAEKNRIAGKVLPLLPEWVVMMTLRKNTEARLFPASGNSELLRAYMLEQSYGMMSKAQFVNRYYCVIDPFSPPDLRRTGIPALIVEADNDPLVEPALRTLLKATYPSADVATYHGVGHFPYISTPDAYTAMIREFFSYIDFDHTRNDPQTIKEENLE